MALQDEIENFTSTVEDAVSYPILTRDTSDFPSNRNGSSSSTITGLTSATRTARQTIRDLLGWRCRPDDTKGFLAALNKAFCLTEVEGRTQCDWKPQSYMVQADMGEITGAQASVYKQACVALENALPLLDGLTSLRTDSDAEDIEAMRAIIRTEMTELVGEFGTTGGPRVQRVDSFFEKLLGPLPPASFDPEKVGGQLARLRHRFGLVRARVNTIPEEQNLTNFLILVDYVNSLFQSWDLKRPFFDRTAEPFLGTQLVLISEVLDAILEQLQETYDAMDSVFFGPAERQTTELKLRGGAMTVTEILSWVENFASVEGRQLIQEGGKDGVVVFTATIKRLRGIVHEAARIANRPSKNPVRPFHTKRVALALEELGSYLSTGFDRAREIHRRTIEIPEHLGEEENTWWDESAPIEPNLRTRVDYFDWLERLAKGKNAWQARRSGAKIFRGDKVKVVLWGFFPHLPLSLDFGADIIVEEIQYDPSKRKVVAVLQVDDNGTIGPHTLLIEDCEQEGLTVLNALMVSAHRQQPTVGTIAVDDFDPCCGHQGQTKTLKFTGQGLTGCGVCFGTGEDIKTTGASYSDDGTTMNVEIVISRHARIGDHDVMVFGADGRSAMPEDKFEVLAEMPVTLGPIAVTSFTPAPDPCEEETRKGGSSQDNKMGDKGKDKGEKTQTSIATDVATNVPAPVKACLEAAGVTEVRNYRKRALDEPQQIAKGRKGEIQLDLEEDQPIDSAWLVSSNPPHRVIKCADVRQKGRRVTLGVEPQTSAYGEHDVVHIMKDTSVEHVLNAVTFPMKH